MHYYEVITTLFNNDNSVSQRYTQGEKKTDTKWSKASIWYPT